MEDAKQLVEAVRQAAARHRLAWGELVPAPDLINHGAEAAEDAAYAEMEAAKQKLRAHICREYGIGADELDSLTR